MSGRTPTDDEVRQRYIEGASEWAAAASWLPEYEGAWDRWLAAHDDQVRAEERERIARAIEEWWSEQETSDVFTGGAWSRGEVCAQCGTRDREGGHMNPWACRVCARHYPVQSLARDCERKHASDDTPGRYA